MCVGGWFVVGGGGGIGGFLVSGGESFDLLEDVRYDNRQYYILTRHSLHNWPNILTGHVTRDGVRFE